LAVVKPHFFDEVCLWQVAAFADQVTSGALVDLATSRLRSEKKRLEDKFERLRTKNTKAIRDKSATENKSCNLLDKVGTLEKENEGLSHQLGELKDTMAKSQSEAQAARDRAAL
jgi:predicted RNase H-like nuclease (RuvC/YqgF family)